MHAAGERCNVRYLNRQTQHCVLFLSDKFHSIHFVESIELSNFDMATLLLNDSQHNIGYCDYMLSFGDNQFTLN
jgi:hypothetical protein